MPLLGDTSPLSISACFVFLLLFVLRVSPANVAAEIVADRLLPIPGNEIRALPKARHACLLGSPTAWSQLMSVLQWQAQICVTRWVILLRQRSRASRGANGIPRLCGQGCPACGEFKVAGRLQSRPRTRPPHSRYQSSPCVPTSTSVSLSVTSILCVPACIAGSSVCRASRFRCRVCRLCLHCAPLTVGPQRTSPVRTDSGGLMSNLPSSPCALLACLVFGVCGFPYAYFLLYPRLISRATFERMGRGSLRNIFFVRHSVCSGMSVSNCTSVALPPVPDFFS